MNGTHIEGCPDLITPVYDAKKRKAKNYPQHVNRASEAGHPCMKYLVLCRTKWELKQLHGAELEFIFEGGRMIEELAVTDLKEAGFTVVEQNRPFSWREFELSGHVDGKVMEGSSTSGASNIAYPIEIKGLNMFDFDRLNSIEDFLQSKKSWLKKYPAQLALYMLMDNIEYGCFYIKRVPGFRPKQIWMHLDYTFAEDILQKLERVNKHVKEGTLPEGVNDPNLCNYCSFFHVCAPDMIGTEIEVISEIEIEEAIDETVELENQIKSYRRAEKKWKKALEGKEKVKIGEYIITGRWIKRKGYTVPDGEYWQSKILVKPTETRKVEE
jgi:CRISPR/Cas system-associated exonuclease Cas4 (RecB family)